jgi:hypothetical protein
MHFHFEAGFGTEHTSSGNEIINGRRTVDGKLNSIARSFNRCFATTNTPRSRRGRCGSNRELTFFFPSRSVLALVAAAGLAYGKLPPQSDAAKAQAAQTAATAAWDDKVSADKTCRPQDRAAAMYRSNLKAAAKDIPTPTATAPCADPGPYVAPVTPVESKSLEASEAHSPAGTATSPPSTNIPAAEMPKATK